MKEIKITEPTKIIFDLDAEFKVNVEDGKKVVEIEPKEIIEPVYTNQYGEKFFDGNELIWFVQKFNVHPVEMRLSYRQGSLDGSKNCSEIFKTEKRCYQWIYENYDKLK